MEKKVNASIAHRIIEWLKLQCNCLQTLEWKIFVKVGSLLHLSHLGFHACSTFALFLSLLYYNTSSLSFQAWGFKEFWFLAIWKMTPSPPSVNVVIEECLARPFYICRFVWLLLQLNTFSCKPDFLCCYNLFWACPHLTSYFCLPFNWLVEDFYWTKEWR